QLKDEHIRLRETLSEREEECVRLRSEAQTTDLRELSHKQAMELSRKQIEWLNAELTASQEGLQKARSELAATKSELHSQLSAAKAELRSTTSSLDECQRRTKQAEASHYNSMQEVRKIKEELAEATEQFKREMRSQAKMCEIWEKSAKEATTRVEEIDRLLQEAESRRKEAEQQAQEAVELAESERDELARQLDRANETIRRFERELDTVNKSIESGTNLISPSASRVMRSGKTPTQILAEFNELQDEYDRVLAERNDLESSLNAILQDIEERAPVLAFEREAFEKLQLYCDDLARELEAMRGDLEESQSQERERANELQVAHRENKSLRQQVRDLGRQVSRLIRQIEEIRRGSPIPDSEAFEPNSIDSNEGQIDRVISQSLVTFRDIQELQLQNQRLLRTTRELASKVAQEEEDRRKQLQAEENEAIAEAKNVISRLESELRTLRTRLGALERERNMLKERAERKSPGDHSERKPQPGVEPSAEDATVSKDDNTQLRRLEDQFNLYQSESVSIRQTLERENEGLRSELSETRIRAVKAEAQVAFEQDRIGMLKSEQDALLRELAHLRETVSRLHAQLESYEQSSTQAAQSLAETTSELQQAKRMLAMVEAERDALRRSEARWLEAEQQWRSEKLNMTQILQNTTRLRDEWQRASEAKVAAAEQQIESIRGDLASAREEIRAKDGEIQRLQYRREADTSLWQERVTKLNDALGDAKEQTAQARQKVAEIQ
ncbi:Filament-forming protein, partial [Spiromyces aspiralis]